MYSVYILNQDGKPLMPTRRFGKVRRLLKSNQAKVVKRKPFTIQLLYQTTEFTQPITMGIDTGYSEIGYSIKTENREIISGQVTNLKGMSKRLDEKRMYRRNRRNRLRYRKPRFNNRKRKDGWLPPSIQHKQDTHVRLVEIFSTILPITKVRIEVGRFDLSKENPSTEGFDTIKEFVKTRDKFTCQICFSNTNKLHVHHVIYRSLGGTNTPKNLLTVCTQCHTPQNHAKDGVLYKLMKEAKEKSYKSASFMSIVQHSLPLILLEKGFNVEITEGFETKRLRDLCNIEKTHNNDAFVIAGGTLEPRGMVLNFIQRRRNNRSLERFYDAKYKDVRDDSIQKASVLSSGRTTRNTHLPVNNQRIYRGETVSKGRRAIRKQRYYYQPGDLVEFKGTKRFVKATMNNGKSVSFNDSVKPGSTKPENLKLIKYGKGLSVI